MSAKGHMGEEFLTNVALDHDLLFEFFLTFARFEFSLKAAGFVTGDHREAKPDWLGFGETLDLDLARQDSKCAEAIDYLGLHPPWRQVMKANALAWDSTVAFTRLDRLQCVLDLVRRVRNNLFHGGKFNDEVHSGPGRNELLIRHSLSVLHRCLELSESVAERYRTATL